MYVYIYIYIYIYVYIYIYIYMYYHYEHIYPYTYILLARYTLGPRHGTLITVEQLGKRQAGRSKNNKIILYIDCKMDKVKKVFIDPRYKTSEAVPNSK